MVEPEPEPEPEAEACPRPTAAASPHEAPKQQQQQQQQQQQSSKPRAATNAAQNLGAAAAARDAAGKRGGGGMLRAPVASKARVGAEGASAVDLAQTLRRQQDERIRAAIEYLSSPGVWSRSGEENMAHVQNAFCITDTEGMCACGAWPSPRSRQLTVSRHPAVQQSRSSSTEHRRL